VTRATQVYCTMSWHRGGSARNHDPVDAGFQPLPSHYACHAAHHCNRSAVAALRGMSNTMRHFLVSIGILITVGFVFFAWATMIFLMMPDVFL
jgi:hypothetical protein